LDSTRLDLLNQVNTRCVYVGGRLI
jgi:hypothetical protein